MPLGQGAQDSAPAVSEMEAAGYLPCTAYRLSSSASSKFPIAFIKQIIPPRHCLVLGCSGPKVASKLSKARWYNGSASEYVPILQSKVAKLLTEPNVLGCSGPKVASWRSKARWNNGSASE
ncbi:unnamed protein product [Prorocentrum cordatum]|uniref:Uncharacterized protein n=1 Tax=Prorocentrum cordatum TaxID=2364126 RepID=A0ABN9WLH7_9DINO|nr:unnamed protein product [Polarella glacialis]